MKELIGSAFNRLQLHWMLRSFQEKRDALIFWNINLLSKVWEKYLRVLAMSEPEGSGTEL
jgi:hypothetical protein